VNQIENDYLVQVKKMDKNSKRIRVIFSWTLASASWLDLRSRKQLGPLSCRVAKGRNETGLPEKCQLLQCNQLLVRLQKHFSLLALQTRFASDVTSAFPVLLIWKCCRKKITQIAWFSNHTQEKHWHLPTNNSPVSLFLSTH
jgi:hypothetical protein